MKTRLIFRNGWLVASVVAVLALVPVASVSAVTQEVTVDEEELMARVRAEIERAIAELRASMESTNAAQEALRPQIEQRLRDSLRTAEHSMRSAELQMAYAMRHAMANAERAAAHAAEQAQLRIGRGGAFFFLGCDEYGYSVLDQAGDLGLTEAQIDQVEDIQRSYRRESIQRRADVEVAEMDLENLMENPDADLNEVRAKLEEVSSLEVDSTIAGLRLKRDVRQVLSMEQIEQLDDVLDDVDDVFIWSGDIRHRGRLGC